MSLTLTAKEVAALRRLHEYGAEDERADYEVSECPERHIYRDYRTLERIINRTSKPIRKGRKP